MLIKLREDIENVQAFLDAQGKSHLVILRPCLQFIEVFF